MKIEPAAVAMSRLPHHSLVFEAETLIEVAGAIVVLKDIQEEPVGAEFTECDSDHFGENASAQALAGGGDDHPLQFD